MANWVKTLLWIIALALFLRVEFKSIDKDREDAQTHQAEIEKQERDSFNSVLDHLNRIISTLEKLKLQLSSRRKG